ncbi:MAG: hypothetical protein Q7T20_00860, partial [Saprospiraceae bacterium]|nr:hypothetical protein [Saprospiraceae bacterium]
PSPETQNPDIYPTILSGDVGVSGDSNDNSYSVLTSSGDLDESTLLEGLIIEEGSATSDNPNDLWFSHRKSGGGLYIKTGNVNRLKIRDCIFRRNRAINGAHIFVWQPNGQSSLRVENCQFVDGIGGSAFWFAGNSPDSIFISHCSFLRHRNSPGVGAIVLFVSPYNTIKKVILEHCQIKDCEVLNPLNTVMAGIGGDTAVMRNCMIRNNIHSGGDLFSIGGVRVNFLDQDTFLSNRSSINGSGSLLVPGGDFLFSSKQQIKNCIFEKNEETHLFSSTFSTNFSRCVFRDNVLERGLFLDQNTLEYSKLTTVENSIFERNIYQALVAFQSFQGNTYPTDNKGFVFNQNHFRENTGLFFDARHHNIIDHTSTVTWNYCTFSDNRFPNGHSGDTLPYLFHLGNIDFATFNSCVFDQTLLDSSYLFYDSLCHIQLKNNVFKIDSCAQTFKYGDDVLCDTSNFWGLSPIFEDKTAGNYRLTGCSPGINKGDVQLASQLGLSVDLNNGSRAENGFPDIGAFENKLFLQGSVVQYSCLKPATGSLAFEGNACGPYTFEWWNGIEAGNSIINLPAGKYELSVTDSHGIVYFDTLLLPEFESMAIDTLLISPSSAIDQDGSIEVTDIFNGQAPYNFNWDIGDSTSFIDGLTAGYYGLTITDDLGCQAIFRFELKAPVVGTQTIGAAKHLIYLTPNVLGKGMTSKLFSDAYFSEIIIVDALGRVVFQKLEYGKEAVLPEMRDGGVFWVFVKDYESKKWMQPLPLIVY